jgi:hypothetical protein
MEHIVRIQGIEVMCYGSLEDNSNFDVVCDEEEDDSCWVDGNTETGEPFKTWEECVEHLLGMYASTIIEISAV